MRIDIIYGGWLSAPNGVSIFLRAFKKNLKYFKAENTDISIFSLDLIQKRDFEEKTEVQSIKKRLKNYIKKIAPKNALFSWIMIYFIHLRHAKKVVKMYIDKKDECVKDILFFNDIFTCYFYLKDRKENKGKVILVLHTNGDTWKMLRVYYPKLERSYYYKNLIQIENFVVENVDKVGFVADLPRKNFLNLHPTIDSSKTFFIYNGIESKVQKKDINGMKKGKIEFCCVASLSERKGQRFVIEALANVKSSLLDKIHMTFVGDGSDKGYLQKLVSEYKLDKNVIFVGSVNDVEKYLVKSDIFILFSQDEGLPISIIEAMSVGLPILTTEVGGIPEMVNHGENGFVLNPFDKKSLEDTIVNIVNEKYDLNEMGKKSRYIYGEKFKEESMIKSYNLVFNGLTTND